MKEREIILAHKKVFTILVYTGLVFFGCFTFPMLNLTKDFPQNITILNLIISGGAYFYIGKLQGLLTEQNAIGRMLAISTALTIAGFACRFLMEYGEISNTYNFTAWNIIVHLLVALGIIFSAAYSTYKEE